MKKICFGTAGKAWKGGLKGRTYLNCHYTWVPPPPGFSRCGFLSAAAFLWGILAFRIIVETICKPFTLFHSKWETKLRYQGQLNHPTPRMTNKLLCCILPHVPWAPLHPTISPSLKRKRICYSFSLFKIVCHFSMVTSQEHHYTNKPTSQYSFIIAYVAILMAREGIDANCVEKIFTATSNGLLIQ